MSQSLITRGLQLTLRTRLQQRLPCSLERTKWNRLTLGMARLTKQPAILINSGTWLTHSWRHLSQVFSALGASLFPSSSLQYKREEKRVNICWAPMLRPREAVSIVARGPAARSRAPQTQIHLHLVPNSLARAAFPSGFYGKSPWRVFCFCVFSFLFFFFLMKAIPFETQVATDEGSSRNALWS